jgi:hypothetical protein
MNTLNLDENKRTARIAVISYLLLAFSTIILFGCATLKMIINLSYENIKK